MMGAQDWHSLSRHNHLWDYMLFTVLKAEVEQSSKICICQWSCSPSSCLSGFGSCLDLAMSHCQILELYLLLEDLHFELETLAQLPRLQETSELIWQNTSNLSWVHLSSASYFRFANTPISFLAGLFRVSVVLSDLHTVQCEQDPCT